MAKKSRKARKDKGRLSSGKSGSIQSAEILRQFKAHWKAAEWEQSLISYRRWCNRTNKKRNPKIEGELLFRLASSCYSRKQYEKAVGLLKESEKIYPENRRSSLYCMGVAFARSGQLPESKNIFSELDDSYHKDIITALLNSDTPFPENIPPDLAFQQDMILKFWNNLNNPEAVPSSSNALNNLKDAYTLFSSGKDPSSKLKLLESKTGFNNIAEYLKLLAAVYKRGNIQIRNLLTKNANSFFRGGGASLLEIHMQYLLKEQNYKEILVLNELLFEIKASPAYMVAVKDIALFHLGLKEIQQGQMERAQDCYSGIKSETSPVLHNKALILQKLEQFNEANECWTALCRKDKKPRRSDPEDVRRSYGIMLKYIAENYRKEALPDKAQLLFKEALALDKMDRDALEALYEINTDNGNHQSALNYAKQLFEIDRDNDEYLFNYTSELLEFNRIGDVIPLYEAACTGKSNSQFYREGLSYCYIKSALDVRSSKLEETKKFVGMVKSLMEQDTYHFSYLEGYIFHRDGYPRKAMKKINQAIDMVEGHIEEFDLGCKLYEDGFIKQALKLFREIAACGCGMSGTIIESIFMFLSMKGSMEHVYEFCDTVEDSPGWDYYNIADQLFINKQAAWALKYSSKLIRQLDADEYDRYFHLMILNEIGNSKDTLDYARDLLVRAENNDDEGGIYVYKRLIKEIKTRGRFKPAHE
ncbi:MAG: hypothetical protein L3J12_07390 [Spirochaetales bacterium]|nr:hypothetical protein [Spirochaetales bacterium]